MREPWRKHGGGHMRAAAASPGSSATATRRTGTVSQLSGQDGRGNVGSRIRRGRSSIPAARVPAGLRRGRGSPRQHPAGRTHPRLAGHRCRPRLRRRSRAQQLGHLSVDCLAPHHWKRGRAAPTKDRRDRRNCGRDPPLGRPGGYAIGHLPIVEFGSADILRRWVQDMRAAGVSRTTEAKAGPSSPRPSRGPPRSNGGHCR